MRFVLPAAVVAVLLLCGPSSGQSGHFTGDLIVKVLPDGENFELVRDFSYIDSEEMLWTSPAGFQVNGASIPRWLWSFVGSPMRGKYREASVIHDFYCVDKSRPWELVHKTFYEAMLANGVTVVKASAMYAAVYRFGPRWDVVWKGKCPPGMLGCLTPSDVEVDIGSFTPEPNPEELRTMVENIENGMALDEVIKTADIQLSEDLYDRAQTIYNESRIRRDFESDTFILPDDALKTPAQDLDQGRGPGAAPAR